jgi:hypothetical protein
MSQPEWDEFFVAATDQEKVSLEPWNQSGDPWAAIRIRERMRFRLEAESSQLISKLVSIKSSSLS